MDRYFSIAKLIDVLEFLDGIDESFKDKSILFKYNQRCIASIVFTN